MFNENKRSTSSEKYLNESKRSTSSEKYLSESKRSTSSDKYLNESKRSTSSEKNLKERQSSQMDVKSSGDDETSPLEDQVFDDGQGATRSDRDQTPQSRSRSERASSSGPPSTHAEKTFYDDRKSTLNRRRLKLEQKAEKKIQKLEQKIEREKRKVGWEESQTPGANLPLPDPRVQKSLVTMIDMGFSNENGTLLVLLESKEGDIGKVIDILQRQERAIKKEQI